MTAFNRAELRTMVRDSGDYQNVRRFSNDFLNTILQRGFGRFWEMIAKTHQGWWDTEGTVPTVANQAYVSLASITVPGGTEKVWRVQGIDLLDGSEYTPLSQIGINDRHRYGSGTGRPSAYRTSARGADLYQTPDAVYTLRVLFTPTTPALSDSESREWFNGWEEFMIEWAKYEIAKRERMPLKGYLDAVTDCFNRITSGAGERRQQEPEYLKLYELDTLDICEDGIL